MCCGFWMLLFLLGMSCLNLRLLRVTIYRNLNVVFEYSISHSKLLPVLSSSPSRMTFRRSAMGALMAKPESPTKVSVPETKLELKIVEAMKGRAVSGSSMKSFDSVVLKFPKIDDSFRKCKTVFDQFDEDENGVIDQQELRKCFRSLDICFAEEELEINDLFEACDVNEDRGMNFNEFVVLLCLVHLLKQDPTAPKSMEMGMPDLEVTLEILVDAFVFLDKNKDGYVSKSEMVQAINETISGERSSARIAMKRFEEMDWDKNGMVNFKEYLFAFVRWVGTDDNEEEEDD